MKTLETTVSKAESKAALSVSKMLLLGFLAGAFIAFGAQGSNMAAFNLLSDPSTYGIGRMVAGLIFPCGLILVILAGAELFTGNVLMIAGVLDKRITVGRMLMNWCFVYIGNLIGSLFIAWLICESGLLSSGGDLLGAMTVKIGAGKAALPFGKAFILGILCNWLVCLAVWLAFSTDSIPGKILGIFFPIWMFVTSGFEHSVANMYYIPAAMMAKADFGQAALDLGLSAEALDGLDLSGFLVGNLLPVTLGNIVGGGLFVAVAYYLAYRSKN